MTWDEIKIPLNEGKLVRRASWEKDECLYLQGGYMIDVNHINHPILKEMLKKQDKDSLIEIYNHVDKFINKTIEVNYQLPKEDLDATDWEIIKGEI